MFALLFGHLAFTTSFSHLETIPGSVLDLAPLILDLERHVLFNMPLEVGAHSCCRQRVIASFDQEFIALRQAELLHAVANWMANWFRVIGPAQMIRNGE